MPKELIGYADAMSVAPGDVVSFKVSTDEREYDAAIVRLIHGDANGPGYKEELVQPAMSRIGRRQFASCGSYAIVGDHARLSMQSLTLQMWIYPTTPAKGSVQGLLAKWKGDAGYALVIGENGELGLWIGDGRQVARVHAGHPLRARQWYFVIGAFDASTGGIRLQQIQLGSLAMDHPRAVSTNRVELDGIGHNDSPLLFAALHQQSAGGDRGIVAGFYNGKIERPVVIQRALLPDEVERLSRGEDARSVAGADLVAVWDFSAGISSPTIRDVESNTHDGRLVNMPTRAVTGHGWRGEDDDFRHAASQYGAIHFHDDDLDDAGWETDFQWQVSEGARSGFYAARLRGGGEEDHIPFFVRPGRTRGAARALVLAPTFTYLAYANERLKALPLHAAAYTARPMVKDRLDLYLEAHPELGMSLYDAHSDGSGCCYSSHLRPITNMRPKYRQWQVAGPRHLAADLYLVDWLETKGIAYDVATDHDLHRDGAGLLADYRVVLTGTHPEYWSRPMLEAMEGFLATGGRQMYLGGNGYYWVTGLGPDQPHAIEVRRGIAGSRAWTSSPGELHLGSTGELGGLWRYRGRPPNRIAGIGFTAMGYHAPTPGYRRQPASFDSRAAFIFEGIGDEEIIGDFGLVLGGAAGDEIDRLDYDLGTPPHALLLASATGHDPRYTLPVVEDFPEISPVTMKQQAATVRADIVYFETPNDGAVFSAGAITWCGSLSHNNYDNNVSRITENVLRRFLG